ncbi:MAG: bacillithiol biosynthesis deacetylase BshB1 [Coprothermobacterota bacterium]|nr:bacillithiol biosynthesis deacetylase BshB1 [Caldisericota bacterium]MDI6869497.1 bacillithiol biosynthesis deacetylase BshB1 [Coprothermobacterota bacterium]
MARILTIGAHPDDVEIGMGGTIASLKGKGHEVTILDLTDGEPTPTGSREIRLQESQEAAKVLGVDRRITLDLPNRYLLDSIENRLKVAEVIREVRPDVIFLHYWTDAHPDHRAASQLSEAARFYAKLTKTEMSGEPFYPRRLFYFFSSHFRLLVKPAFVFDISQFIEVKIRAISCYKSQFNEIRGNLRILEDLKITARWWGSRAHLDYGEPFASRECLSLKEISAIL